MFFVLVDGICKAVSAGYIEVGIYVDGCPGFSAANAGTGWENPRHMMIYEIDARSGVGKIVCRRLIFKQD